MERQQCNSLQNFDESKSEILKKRLLKSSSAPVCTNLAATGSHQNVLLNTLRAPISSSMIVTSVGSGQGGLPLQHGLVTHSLAPVKLHTNPSSYPLQLSTVHVPVQIPGTSSNINVPVQLSGPTSSMPLQIAPVQVANHSTMLQMPNSASNSIQLTLPNSVSSGTVQLRGSTRNMPHVVYIQTPTGLKPVTSTDVISQASTSGNPPQIIVRRPVTSNSNIHLISNVNNKPNIAPKLPGHGKSSILAPTPTPPIVIQKPKTNEKVIVPVSIAPGNSGKQTIAYLSSVKKPNSKNLTDNQSILISNNQSNVNSNNQKLFLTPMNMPKIQNTTTKYILPVTLPATMASKGPIINLQIANGQIQNDPQGNITVMRDSAQLESTDMPPLQPLGKMVNVNGKESNSVSQSANKCETYTISIPGSRAEPTGEQGEYTLSIPETNASMNDDIYTVSIADDEGGQSREKSFTLAIPEKGKSLLNRNMIERNDIGSHHVAVAAPAILRRSNSDNGERKNANANLKRRISLCNENLSNKNPKTSQPSPPKPPENPKTVEAQDTENDDHRVPSLFCDEKLDKDLECKVILGDSDEDYKDETKDSKSESEQHPMYYKRSNPSQQEGACRAKRESVDSALEEDPPGLLWSNGVARLHGSALQFQTNEFGLIDVVDASDPESPPPPPLAPRAKYHTPLKQRVERARQPKPASPEDLYRCEGCGCHGMAADFITPDFCSLACQTEVRKLAQKKRDRERAELTRRRNKMKKLLMRKPALDDAPPPPPQPDGPRKPESVGEMTEAMLKMSEDLIENEKYPWMCGKNGFSWMRYLDFCKAKAAPVKLFKDPFPYNRNGFKVGMRMEAIDPQHASLFCVVSVREVQGYRLRLHFDEYPELHDFWVNADSVDIFPAGWCERNGRALRPPHSHAAAAAAFSWPLYLKQLEAEDRINDMVCAATVADMLDARLLITFDSWDSVYDSRPLVSKRRAARAHAATGATCYPITLDTASRTGAGAHDVYTSLQGPGVVLVGVLPSGDGGGGGPPRAFKTRAPQGFKPGMKLEVVDKRELSTAGPCGVGGCRGLGSLRGGAHKTHVAASACPYRAPASPAPQDRLAAHPALTAPRVLGPPKPAETLTPTSDTVKEKPTRGRPPKHKRVEEVSKTDPVSDEESASSSGGSAKRWRGEGDGREEREVREERDGRDERDARDERERRAERSATDRARALQPDVARHVAALQLPSQPDVWTQLVLRIVSNEVPEVPVVSPSSGAVFERRIIEKYIIENGVDPISGKELHIEDLIEIKTPAIVKPKPPSATSIPATLKSMQDEWDALMLHTFTQRQQLQTARQELSHALYQHDAACRVIARLTKEVTAAREALATLKPQAGGLHSASVPGILALDINPSDHSRILTGGNDRNATVFNKDTEQVVAILKGHTKKVTRVIYHPDEDTVITASPDHTIRVWNVPTYVKIWDLKEQSNVANFPGHVGPVTSISFSENGYYLATAAEDACVKLWDLRKLKNFKTIQLDEGYAIKELCFDQSGTYLAVAGTDVRVYLCRQWQELKVFNEHTASATGVRFGRHAQCLASTSMDRTLKLYGI
ncbi:hypothetical protein MSG28_003723, partial [Choristoneura fumiferana]